MEACWVPELAAALKHSAELSSGTDLSVDVRVVAAAGQPVESTRRLMEQIHMVL